MFTGISVLAPNNARLYTLPGVPAHIYCLWLGPGLGDSVLYRNLSNVAQLESSRPEVMEFRELHVKCTTVMPLINALNTKNLS